MPMEPAGPTLCIHSLGDTVAELPLQDAVQIRLVKQQLKEAALLLRVLS